MGNPLLPWLLLVMFFVVILMEMFLPTAGTLMVLSILLAIGAITLAFMQSLTLGVVMLTIIVCSIPVLVGIFGYVWPRTPMGRRFTIEAPDPDSVLPESMRNNPLAELKGSRGTVVVAMLPTGEIEIDGKRYRATCQSGSADVGQAVRVVALKMGRLQVLPVEIADDHQSAGGFEESLDTAVENTSFEDFEWDD